MAQAPGQVKRLYFLGGEPLLVKEVAELLQYLIDRGLSKDISIAVVSNGSVTGSWLDLIPHFKGLELAISIDGFGDHYDYIRYPGKWEKLVKNLDVFRRLPNVSLGAAITLQFYNALNVCDLFRYSGLSCHRILCVARSRSKISEHRRNAARCSSAGLSSAARIC